MKLKIEIDIDDLAFLYDNVLAITLKEVGDAAINVEGCTNLKCPIEVQGHKVGHWEISA